MTVMTAARTGGTAGATPVLARSDVLRQGAAYATIGAGLVHGAVAPEHFSEWWAFGAFFVALAAFQVLWGVFAVERIGRRAVDAAIVLNVATALLWAWTRLVGLPLGPEPGEREAVGAADVLTTAMELVAVALLIASRRLSGRSADKTVRRPALVGAVTALAVGLLAAGPAMAVVMSGAHHH
jgi:hypothetical protein